MKFLKKAPKIYIKIDGLTVTTVYDFIHFKEVSMDTLSSQKSVEKLTRIHDSEISEQEFDKVLQKVISILNPKTEIA